MTLPVYGMPVSDELNAARWRPGARTVLQHLRTELHAHQIVGTLVYDEGQARLVIDSLVVWANDDGTLLCWGENFLEEPADHCVIGEDDLPGAAERVAELHARLTAASAAPAP
ncbi:hypothetical protein [Streptosporangium subroseum]|uniref:hypothetical protein n=1 Tax=Streptosporangium subroseum TaxID=106412 RepID=UPI00308FD8AA|nr:hypothetical protein OHB15_40160 [Streptosporangium subroseum]